MAFDMIEAMTLIAREKNIEFDAVLETLKGSLLAAAKKKYAYTDNISFKFDRKNNELTMMITKQVVKEVEDPNIEISLKEAQEIDPEAEVGDEIDEYIGSGKISSIVDDTTAAAKQFKTISTHIDPEKIDEIIKQLSTITTRLNESTYLAENAVQDILKDVVQSVKG